MHGIGRIVLACVYNVAEVGDSPRTVCHAALILEAAPLILSPGFITDTIVHNPERQNAHVCDKSRTPPRTLQHPFPSLVAHGDCVFVFVALRNTNVDKKNEKISTGLAKWGSVVSGGLRSPIYSESQRRRTEGGDMSGRGRGLMS